MKKFLASALSAALLLSALAGCSGSGSGSASGSAPAGSGASNGDKVVKIGVFEPASGDSASGGKKEMLGMQFANSETPTVELGGETYQVELVYADNGSSTDKAPSAASQLVSEGVSVVLGSYGSGVSIAAGPIFRDAGIPAMGVYCLGELGNEYDQGLIAFFEQAFTAAGGTVIKDSFPKNNSDFTSYLNKAKSEGAEVIFTPVSIAYATQIITQAAKLGIDIPFLGSDTLDDNKVLEAAKGTNVQLYVSTFYQEGGNPEFDEGIKNYINSNADAKTANGGDDTIAAVTAMGYDAYYVALEALKAAGSPKSSDVQQALWDVEYDGVSGHIAFDDTNGDAIRDTAYIKVCDTAAGAWTLEKSQTA